MVPMIQPVMLDSISTTTTQKINGLDLKKLFVNPNIEDENISDLIVKVMTTIIVLIIIIIIVIKYIPSSDFLSVKYDFISELVRMRVDLV